MEFSLHDLPQIVDRFLDGLKDQAIIGLVGPIGAGKTTFIYHVLQSLDSKVLNSFSSPTFTILNRYETSRWTINHVDLYRLRSFQEFEVLDLIPLFQKPNTLTFIEWADKFPELKTILSRLITLSHVEQNPDLRSISFE